MLMKKIWKLILHVDISFLDFRPRIVQISFSHFTQIPGSQKKSMKIGPPLQFFSPVNFVFDLFLTKN